ncbi:MAG: ferrous iron transport protein B [Candidatus Aerophobetes bacterium]
MTPKKLVIVGSPNVGKSVIFNTLTKRYVTVSNYPGTTVEVMRGKAKIEGREFEVVDTPGMYSLSPMTEEERVSRSILLIEKPEIVLQVVDAKNLERMLPLTLQLIEARLSLVLDLNFMDEAQKLGMKIDLSGLEAKIGIPVVATVATEGKGFNLLKKRLAGYSQRSAQSVDYDQIIASSIREVENLLKGTYPISKRSIITLLLQEDAEIESLVRLKEVQDYPSIKRIIQETRNRYSHPMNYVFGLYRQKKASQIANLVTTPSSFRNLGPGERLSRWMMNPFAGLFIALLTLFGLYEFVGVFGAQISVDFLEKVVFGRYINPFMIEVVRRTIPWHFLQNLFVGEYGIITLGIRYAIAIILPIVATFFFAFSIIEDTGYLPRLAMFVDRFFKKIGLNGRAVIPIVLGFGCDTMATITTRTLETKKERIVASFLLALAIPCSAQLGVILALLAGKPKSFSIWAGVVALNFLFMGYLASRVLPGEKPLFYMEVPPLRWPKLSNVLSKTYSRVEWYFKEVLPIFVLASILIWAGKITGVFGLVIRGVEPLVRGIGLPSEAAAAFLYGFFRRDFGAAGLFDLAKRGGLSGVELVVAVVTLTLFVPCIAQFSITIKERGLKTGLAMVAFIFPFAFLVGFLLNLALNLLGVKL